MRSLVDPTTRIYIRYLMSKILSPIFISISSIVAVIVGWTLNEISFFSKNRQKDKRAMARALTDLLEIRHQVFRLECVKDDFFKKISLPTEMYSVLQTTLSNLLGSIAPNDSLQKRYNEAVDLVASVEPLLAFELRSKDLISPLLSGLQALVPPDGMVVWQNVKTLFLTETRGTFEELILVLARKHGWRTGRQIKKFLQEPIVPQKDLDEIISKLFEVLLPALKKGCEEEKNPEIKKQISQTIASMETHIAGQQLEKK